MLKWPARLFYGWKMVAVGSFTNAVGSAIYHTGFAIFFLPVSRDLAINRAQTSIIFSLSRAEGAFEGPLAGWLVDRFGPKPLLFGGALVTGVGFIALSRVDSYLAFMFTYLVVVSLAYNAGFMHPVMTTVNSWFIRRRGLAFAVTQASHNLGTAIGAPVIAYLVHEHGWRTASIASAFALWILVLPTSLLIVGSPEKVGMMPDGVPIAKAGTPGAYPTQRDFTVREALKTRAYWLLALATTLRLFVINTLSLHMIPIFVWKGVSEPTAALALGALAVLGVPTRILIGVTGDKLPKNLVVACGILVGIAGILQLLFVQDEWSVWVFVAVFSIMEGVIPLNWAMIGDFFGRAKFATLRGTMGLIYTWGAVIGPVAAGWIFDQTDSYAPVLWGMVGFFALAALAFATLKPPGAAAKLEPIAAASALHPLPSREREHDEERV